MGALRRALFLFAAFGVSAHAFTVRGVEYPQEFCVQLKDRDEDWVRERVQLEIFSRDPNVQKLVLQAQRVTEARRTGGRIIAWWTSAANLYRSAAHPIALTNGGDGTYVLYAQEHEKQAKTEMGKFQAALEALGFGGRHLPDPESFREKRVAPFENPETASSAISANDYLNMATRLDMARQNFNHSFLSDLEKHEEKLILVRNLEREPRTDAILDYCNKINSGAALATYEPRTSNKLGH